LKALESSVIGPIVKDFPWESLPVGTTLVDVGGGNGGLCIALAKQYVTFKTMATGCSVLTCSIWRFQKSELKFIIQDLPDTIKNTNLHIEEAFPSTVPVNMIPANVIPANMINEHHTIPINDGIVISIDGTFTPPPSEGTITPIHTDLECIKVNAEAHDFFTTQPRKGDGYSYCLKWIL
jgi:hypothetical protein